MDDAPISFADAEITSPPSLHIATDNGRTTMTFAGDWVWRACPPPVQPLELGVPGKVTAVRCVIAGVKAWDSTLLAVLLQLRRQCAASRVPFSAEGLPPHLKKLLDSAPDAKWPDEPVPPPSGFFYGAGIKLKKLVAGLYHAVYFTGECAQALFHVLRHPKALRWDECRLVMQECGPASLGIVGLISFLTGCILAWQGALQLRQFGAEIYVADLVGVALVREMGPIMVSIVLAGRIGAAFAAHLATMEASEEVDALRTWGFSPVQFLVLPRIVALTAMMPILVLYANLLGIVGGLLVGMGVLGLARDAYMSETWRALHMGDLEIGLAKSIVFAIGVASIGCASGLKADRSAEGVGAATTSSVVKSILFIIIVDAIFGACSQPATVA